jgi:hypothetical protein
MAKVNFLLSERLKVATEKLSKMTNLAEMSTSGQLSSFAGVFKISELTEKEQDMLRLILTEYGEEGQDIHQDFVHLSAITSEVKAINNQAAILHGERIKKAQEILKKYRDGAFTLWLIETYGNRQTPYNFLQYYELYLALPQMLLPKLDEMPRQAAYTLASRQGDFEKKEEIIRSYNGQTKQELLDLIRRTFPLAERDRRAQDLGVNIIKGLQRIVDFLQQHEVSLNPSQQKKAKQLLSEIQSQIKKTEAEYAR